MGCQKRVHRRFECWINAITADCRHGTSPLKHGLRLSTETRQPQTNTLPIQIAGQGFKRLGSCIPATKSCLSHAR